MLPTLLRFASPELRVQMRADWAAAVAADDTDDAFVTWAEANIIRYPEAFTPFRGAPEADPRDHVVRFSVNMYEGADLSALVGMIDWQFDVVLASGASFGSAELRSVRALEAELTFALYDDETDTHTATVAVDWTDIVELRVC